MSFSGLVRQVKRSTAFGSRLSTTRKDSSMSASSNWSFASRKPKKVNAHERAQKDARNKHDDDLSYCDFRGISVQWLLGFQARVESGAEAPGVELVEFLEDCKVVSLSNGKSVFVAKGTTARLINEIDETGKADLFLPLVGNISALLDQFTIKERTMWSTEDVAEFVIKTNEKVWGEGLLFNQVIEFTNPNDVGRPFQGAFVSQPRRCLFRDCIAAIQAYFRDTRQQDLATSFVWIDIFGATQSIATPNSIANKNTIRGEMAEKEKELLHRMIESELHVAMSRFDECLVFFDTWKRPTALKREWCLWELFGRVSSLPQDTDAAIQVILTPEENHAFIREGLMGRGTYQKAVERVCNVDIRSARCSNAEDKFLIDERIKNFVPGAYVSINAKVAFHLKLWVAEECARYIERHRAEYAPQRQTTDMDIEGAKRFAQLLYDTGSLFLNQGNASMAQNLLSDALELRKKLYGSETLVVADSLRGLASVWAEQEKFDKALEALENSLAIRQKIVGSDDVSLIDTLVAIGNLLKDRKDSASREAAKDLFEQAFEIATKTGEQKLRIPALVGIGDVLCRMGKYESALKRYNKALNISESLTGPKTAEIAEIVEKIAIMYFNQSKFAKALQCEEQVLALRVRFLGPDHTKTAATRVFIQRLKENEHKEAD